MTKRNIFTEQQIKQLKSLYIKYLNDCNTTKSKPNWKSFHNFYLRSNVKLPKLDEKQLNNKIIDLRKIFGVDNWPTFKEFKNSQKCVIYKKLFQRSEDSFFLSIEIYNRIKQNNKIETFCILLINAWELLLKGYLVRKFGLNKIYYKGSEKRTISISDAVKLVISNKNDPIRKNIEKLIELRDCAIHLLIPELQPCLSRLFQASVFNYLYYYEELVESKLSFNNEHGLLSLIVDDKKIPEPIIQKQYGVETKNFIKEFVKNLELEENKFNNYQYMIPIEYKLTLSKSGKESDITLKKGINGHTENNGVIIEVPKDPDKTHPYLTSDVVRIINDELLKNELEKFTQYSLLAILFKENIKREKTSPYHYRISKPETHRYSQEFIDLILNKIYSDANYICKCKESYRKKLKNN